MRIKPKKLVIMALLIAMAIILRRILTLHFPIGIVSFAGFPIILAGFLFGPVNGGIVGAVSDVLGYPLFPEGPYSPVFTITSALTGVIPVMILRMMKKDSVTILMLMISIFIGQFITKVLIIPYFLQILFGVPLIWKMVTNFIVEVIHTQIFALMAQPVLMIYGDLYPNEFSISFRTNHKYL